MLTLLTFSSPFFNFTPADLGGGCWLLEKAVERAFELRQAPSDWRCALEDDEENI